MALPIVTSYNSGKMSIGSIIKIKISINNECLFFSTAAKYAMLSIKTQLSTILRHFQVCTDLKLKDICLTFDMMLRNDKGYEMYLKRRAAKV